MLFEAVTASISSCDRFAPLARLRLLLFAYLDSALFL